MTLPVIGITVNTQPPRESRPAQFILAETYVNSVMRAGGAPVLIPTSLTGDGLAALFAKLDGILFTGGSDLDPALFAGQPHPRVYDIDPARDAQELWLARAAAAQNKPFLGICRGIQSINVALGGTLFTDIADQKPNALRHDYFPDLPRDLLAHEVTVTAGSRLASILGSEVVKVNSLHHQGIQQIAPGFTPVAFAPDGLVESLELQAHPFGLAVQWHPECLPQYAEQRALFAAFVQAAAHV